MKIYAIIRLRGKSDTHHAIRKTLELLKLHKVNHSVIYQSDPTLEGMLRKAKDKITWGEITEDVLVHLLNKRGELNGDRKVTDGYLKENTEYSSIKEFVKALFAGKAKVSDIPNIQPVFRLSPPRKGFKSLKHPWGRKGDLGYRSEAMSELVFKMA